MKRNFGRAERSDGVRSRRTILLAAANLATTEGLDGLSIGNLAEHIGMSKSGLYAHFGSKEELQLATVETAREIFDAEVVEPTLSIDDPLERLMGICERFLDYVERRVFPGGCFFAAVSTEFANRPGPIKNRVAEVQSQWLAGLVALIGSAQAKGLLDGREEAEQLASELHSYLLLANLAFVLHGQSSVLDRARTALRSRLDLARSRR
jgi:AcrR family transcriptional regulator